MTLRLPCHPLLGFGVPVLAALVLWGLCGWDRGWDLAFRSLGAWATLSLVHLCLLAALLAWPLASTRASGWKWVLLFTFCFLLDLWFLLCPSLSVWRGFRWNWQGKIFATASVIWICLFSGVVTLKDAGITTAWKKGWWIPFLVVFSIFGLMFWNSGKTGFSWDGETFWFQASMPGLNEELAMRGLWLIVLVKAFERQGKSERWAWVWSGTIITLVFGFVHVFQAPSWDQLSWNWIRMTTAFFGLLFLWARCQSGSVWPAVILHNLCNLVAMNRG